MRPGGRHQRCLLQDPQVSARPCHTQDPSTNPCLPVIHFEPRLRPAPYAPDWWGQWEILEDCVPGTDWTDPSTTNRTIVICHRWNR